MGLVIAGLIAVGAIVYFGGANTLDGFGQDMKQVGHKIEHNK